MDIFLVSKETDVLQMFRLWQECSLHRSRIQSGALHLVSFILQQFLSLS